MNTLAHTIAGSVLLLVTAPALAQPAPAAPAAPAVPPAAAAPAPTPVAAPAAQPGQPAPALEPAASGAVDTPPPIASGATQAPEPLPPVVEAPVEAEPAPAPDKVSVGKSGGFWQPSSLIQIWGFLRNLDTGDEDAPKTTTTFRIRRAELRMKGEIAPGLVSYAVMIDPAKTLPTTSVEVATPDDETVSVLQPAGDRSILQDVFITFMSDYADVSVGEFKTPISLEGYGSSSKLIFPERALSSTTFGDRRDMGLRIEKKIGKYLYYNAGVYSGSGLNQADADNEKDLALRLEVYPIKELTVGLVGAATAGKRDGNIRDRVEGDVRYDGNGILLQAEYIRGGDGAEGARTEGQGAYVAGGYTFVERIQPVLRVGFVDRDVDADDDRTTHYEAGLNYYLRAQEARVSLSVSVFDAQDPDTNTRTDAILAAQVSF